MARSQNTRCEGPSFAAVPTHPDPTTNTTCIRTRSASPSSRRSSVGWFMADERTRGTRDVKSTGAVCCELELVAAYEKPSGSSYGLPRGFALQQLAPAHSKQRCCWFG